MTRAAISLRTKLAAALLTMRRPDENGVLQPIVSHEHAQQMSDEQIISLFHFDHYPIPHANEGPDEAWNLQPLLISEHRVKTSKTDVPQIAKTKRVAGAANEHAAVMAAKVTGAEIEQPKPKKVWPKGRKIQSRGFEKRVSP